MFGKFAIFLRHFILSVVSEKEIIIFIVSLHNLLFYKSFAAYAKLFNVSYGVVSLFR